MLICSRPGSETSLEEPLPAENARIPAGVPDGFNRFWTPYRMTYIHGEGKPSDSNDAECPFCAVPAKSDEEGLIVYRGQSCFVIVSLFPYSSGRLLVCPYHCISYYVDSNEEEHIEFGEFITQAVLVEKETAQPQGFNIGISQDEVAGASIATHLHQHIVPRWFGDASFLPIIARVKAVPGLLEDARLRLAAAWPKEK